MRIALRASRLTSTNHTQRSLRVHKIKRNNVANNNSIVKKYTRSYTVQHFQSAWDQESDTPISIGVDAMEIDERLIYLAQKGWQRSLEQTLDEQCVAVNDVRDDTGNSLLHIACENGYKQTILGLLKKGAEVNAVNDHGETPLIVAVKKGWVVSVNILIQYGANLDYVDPQGKQIEFYINEGHHRIKKIVEMGHKGNCEVMHKDPVTGRISYKVKRIAELNEQRETE